jgi:hypothetical protein
MVLKGNLFCIWYSRLITFFFYYLSLQPLIAAEASYFFLDKKVTKKSSRWKGFLPHRAFALQKLATQVRAARSAATFQPKAFPSAAFTHL